MKKFFCKGCGKCCREIKSRDSGKEYPSFSGKGIAITLNEPMLSIFGFEKEAIEKEADKKNISVRIVPEQVLFDTRNKKTVILTYTFSGEMCAFLSNDKKCTIYENRPVHCRAHPAPVGLRRLSESSGKNPLTFNTKVCDSELSMHEYNEAFKGRSIREIIKLFAERFGDTFFYKCYFEFLSMQQSLLIRKAIDEKGIKFAEKGTDMDLLKRRIQKSEKLELHDYMEFLGFPRPKETTLKGFPAFRDSIKKMIEKNMQTS